MNLGIKKPQVQPPQTELTQRMAKMDEASMKGGIARLKGILAEVRAERTQSTSNTDLVNNHEADWIDKRPEEEHNFAGQESNDADNPRIFSEYISGHQYKSRRIREHQDWKVIMQEIFIVFMQCSHKTSQWGNEGNWNHNFQPEDY